jgi:hypothetical protein
MNHSHVDTIINKGDYDAIVSIGNKCPTAMLLSSVGVYGQAFPFDYIPTTPELILKYMKDQTDFYPEKDIVRNKDDVWFGHFNLSNEYEGTMQAFRGRFESLFQLLRDKKRILFVYTSEADMYNEFNCRYKDNYADLLRFRDYLIETYEYADFLILAVHTNKIFDNQNNIINYTMNVDQKYMSDNGETHQYHIFTPYRNVLTSLFKRIFGLA